jgi:hypothetical protein
VPTAYGCLAGGTTPIADQGSEGSVRVIGNPSTLVNSRRRSLAAAFVVSELGDDPIVLFLGKITPKKRRHAARSFAHSATDVHG